jgi:hypothetical protein
MMAIVWVPECSNDGSYWHNSGSMLVEGFWWRWKHLVVVVEMLLVLALALVVLLPTTM